jgi:glycosyltransferase involved in cell wall biosynthesis
MGGLSIVYIVNTVYPFHDGGYERRFFELARRLAMRGCSVTVFTSAPRFTRYFNVDFVDVCYDDGFFTRSGFRSIGRELRFSVNLFRKLMEYRGLVGDADIVEVNQTPPFHIFPVRLFKTLSSGRFLTVMTVHEDLMDYFGDYWRIRLHGLSPLRIDRFLGLASKSLYLNSLSCADYYVSPSKPTLKSLLSHGLDRGRVFYIPNGIDTELQGRYCSTSHDNGKVVISFLGRLVPEKRPEWVVYALKWILNIDPKLMDCLEVNIIGKGPLTPILNGLVKKFSLDRIVKLRGYVPDDEKFSLLARSSIFTLPSRREGFSLSLLEAMFFGAAPIVTVDPFRMGVRGVLELVSHLRNGYVAYSFREFREGLYRLIVDDDLRSELGRKAAETAKLYDWNSIIPLAENIYRRISSGVA